MADFEVTTVSALNSALAAATGGDTITVLPGVNYGAIAVVDRDYGSEVVVRTDPENPAVFKQFRIEDSAWLTIDGLRFEADKNVQSGPSLTALGTTVLFEGAQNSKLLNSRILGDISGGLGDYTTVGVGTRNGTGLSSNITISGNEITGYQNCCFLRNLRTGIVFGNWIHHWNNGDAFPIDDVDGLLIDENFVTNFLKEGDAHADIGQTRNVQGGPRNAITWRKNFLSSGEESRTQTLLMQTAPTNVTMEDNVIANGHQWGLRCQGGGPFIAARNTLLHNAFGDTTTVIGAGSASPEPLIDFQEIAATTGNLAEDNIAFAVQKDVGSTVPFSNNIELDRSDYPDYFKDALADELAVFDDYRADPETDGGQAIIAAGQGSIYTRQSGAARTYPAGYLLALGETPTPPDPTPVRRIYSLGGGGLLQTGGGLMIQ